MINTNSFVHDVTTADSVLIKERDAAALLGVSVPTLRRWRLLGRGPTYRKLNGAVRYAMKDVHQFIADRARVSTGRVA